MPRIVGARKPNAGAFQKGETKHPFNDWFGIMNRIKNDRDNNGNPMFLKLIRGQDFKCKPRCMQVYLWDQAKSRNVKIETHKDGEDILCRRV